VTVFTLNGGVCSQQRKAILVILYLLNGDVPALHGVALRAIRSHLPLVNVGVAILAVLPDVGENRLDVALRALHLFVHAAKGILGLAVVEFRDSADGLPAGGGVAVFTRNCKGPVRTTGDLPLRQGCGRISWLPG